MKLFEKIQKWYYFHLANPVVRKGEHGGFRWTFRRFWLDIETLSGNFKVRFTAAEHPYAYLLTGRDDENIIGFCQFLYTVGMTITTDQKLVDEFDKALKRYEKRLVDGAKKAEQGLDPEVEEEAAIAFEKEVQEHLELPKKERKKKEKEIDRQFKKASK